jgi:hypothetical protein
MTREQVRKFIGQRRIWVMRLSHGEERHEVVCTHARGSVTLMAGDCEGEDFGQVFCAYKFGSAPQGVCWFTPEKFAAMDLVTANDLEKHENAES